VSDHEGGDVVAVHRVVWQSTCAALGALGTAVALVRSPAAVALLLGVVGGASCLLTLCLARGFWERGRGGRLGMLSMSALIAATGFGALLGYSSLFGGWVLLLAAAVMAGSPRVAQVLARCLRSLGRPSAAPFGPLASALAFAPSGFVHFAAVQVRPLGELSGLSDEQLCKRWRVSCKEVQLYGVQGLDAVDERQLCLDEIERRNAGALAGWLASGPSAWGDPLPYLTGERVGPPTINWDELTPG
jgi:hypothetical protein